MRYAISSTMALLLLFGDFAFARPPGYLADATYPDALINQTFLREYSMGVQVLPMAGGRIYGWKLNDKVTFGRFKGESDEFGFSVELNARQRVEITTDGLRWRKAIGGH
jgi:hypothetical protein